MSLLAATCGTDEFTGSELDARWDVRRPAGDGPTVADGTLDLPIRAGDLITGTATAENLVLQDAPAGGWTATTRLSTAALDVNGEQAGMVLWKGEGPPSADNTFAKVVAIQTNAGVRRFEAIWTDAGGLAVPIPASGADIETWPADVSLRLRHDGRTVTAEYSPDGATWTQIGQPARYDGALRVGLVAIGGTTAGTGGDVAFEQFDLSCGPEVTVSASDQDGTAPLDLDFSSTVSEPASELTWSFGDGATADGGATQAHTFTEPGTYRVSLSALDADGNTTIGSKRVVVRPAAPTQPADDEFTGNALDPKWEVVRPRDTGLDVADGALRLTTYGGDMHGGNASQRNLVLQPLPPGAATVITEIDVSDLTAVGDQVGMVAWRSESPNNFAKVVYNRRSATEYWFERSHTIAGSTNNDGGNTGTVAGSPESVQIRIKSSGGPNPTLTPESSVDGTTWTPVRPAFSLAGTGPVKVGLTYFGPDGRRVAAFDYLRVEGGYALPSAENPCGIDEFTGDALDRTRWSTVVREQADSISVADGALALPALTGDLFGDRDTAQNLVLQDVPDGAWAFTTTLDSSAFDRIGQQAGIVIRKDGETFDKVVIIDKGDEGRWFEHIYTEDQQARLEIGTDTTPPLPAGFPDDVTIRVVSDGETIRAEYQDGTAWEPIGRPAKIGGNVRVGVYAADNEQDGPAIPFERAQLTPLSDEFSGDELDKCRWTQIEREQADAYRVQDGKLELDAGQGEVEDAAPNLIGQPAPAGAWQAETRIDLATTDEGQQAGLLLYKEPENWIKAVLVDKGALSQIELVRVKDGAYQLDAPFKVDVPSSMSSVRLRLRSNGTTLSAQYSPNGDTWTEVGKARDITDLVGGHVGPMALRGPTAPAITAAFDYVRVRSWSAPAADCTPNGTPEAGFARLWNGVDLADTTQAGPGGFDIVDDGAEGCRLVSSGGLGLLWFNADQYGDFVLRTQFKTADATDNSGIFVRFPNPGTDPNIPIAQGLEVQIREGVAGDGEDQKTGSIYNFKRETDRTARPAGEWNDYEIRHEDNTFTITLNGTVVNTWTNNSDQGRNPGYVGIQNHGAADEVSFRNLRIQELDSGPQTNLFDTIGITRSETRQNSGIFGTPTNYSLPAEEMPPSRTVGPGPDDEFDAVRLRMPDTSGTVPNLAAFHGQTLTLRPEDQKQYEKIHFFGMTTDGGPAGGEFVLTYSDDSTQAIRVDFRDWCSQEDSAEHHVAIGPLSQRYRETGADGAPCSIFHVPKDAQAGKTLVSVTLPSTTEPGEPPIQGYLMALTLEEPGGLFEMPDLSGNVQFPDDDEPPVTTHALDPEQPGGNDNWYADPVQVTLTGTDEDGGSGVEQMMYRIDGGPPQSYAGPFDFVVDGAHTLEYRSVDGAGNAEDYKPVDLKVDVNAPETSATTSPEHPRGTDGWFDGDVTVTLSARDGGGSGADATEYRVGGDWQAYDEPFGISEAGVHDVEFRSSDVAGHEEEVRSLRVKVDRTAPVTTARINGAAPQAEYNGAVRVALIRTDGEGSGAVGTEYRIGDGAWTAYAGAFDIDGNSGHRVDFRSRDLVGNVENFRTVAFVIRPAPAPAATPPPAPPPPPAARQPTPFAALGDVARRRSTIAAFRRGRLTVGVTCQAVERGTLRLTVSRATARRLDVASRVLAKRSVDCSDEGRGTVTLKPRRAVRRALARAKRSITATLALRMAGSAGKANDSAPVVLRKSKGR